MNYLVRRKKLGKGSCNGIKHYSQTGIQHQRAWCDPLPDPHDGYVFRWGWTGHLPSSCKVVNKSEAISFVNDKRASRLLFAEHGLAPRTTCGSFGGQNIQYPAVLRPRFHAQGRHLYLVNSEGEAEGILTSKPRTFAAGFYISEYVQKKEEYRVFIVSGRVVWVAKKTPGDPTSVAWNVAQGGRFDNVCWSDWPIKVIKNALACFNLTDLDFGGVDVMVGLDGTPWCLEINSAPSQTSPYRQECTAKAFDYIVHNGRDRIPASNQIGKYRKYIHPAIDPMALVDE